MGEQAGGEGGGVGRGRGGEGGGGRAAGVADLGGEELGVDGGEVGRGRGGEEAGAGRVCVWGGGECGPEGGGDGGGGGVWRPAEAAAVAVADVKTQKHFTI